MIYSIIIISLFLGLSIYISKNIFAPATIVSGLWLFCILAYWFYPHDLFPLSDQFYKGIAIWVSVFAFSSLFAQSFHYNTKYTTNPNFDLRNLYFWLSVITFPLMIWRVYALFQELGISQNILANLRNAAIGNFRGIEEGTSKNYFAVLWLVSYVIELLHFEKKRILNIVVLLVINLSWALIVMSKTNFLNIFLATLTILYFKNYIKPKFIYFSLVAIFLFFVSFQVMRSTKEQIDSDNELKYDFFTLYVLTGMPAFETVKPNSSAYFGENTFRFFYAVGERVGLSDKEAVNPILDFTFVDKSKTMPTNVYTTLYPYYKDFGYTGIFLIGIVVGFFYGTLFKKSKFNSKPSIIIFSILTGSLLTQFMNETTFTTLSFLLQVIFFTYLPYWVNTRFKIALK